MVSKLTRILDAIFWNSRADEDLLRSYVNLEPEVQSQETVSGGSERQSMHDVLDELLADRSLDGMVEDEVTRFLDATGSGDLKIDQLRWWSLHHNRFPAVASLARDILAGQGSTVAR